MGIHRRYAAAFLILFTSWTVQAGQVNVPKRSVEDLIKNVTPVLSDNALGYVRAEGNYPFTYNNKAYTAGPILQTTKIPTSAVKSVLKEGLKTNAPKLLLDATIAASVAAVGWVMTEGVLSKKIASDGVVTTTPGDGNYYWKTNNTVQTEQGPMLASASDPGALCKMIRWTNNYSNSGPTFDSSTTGRCNAVRASDGAKAYMSITRYGSSCPSGATYDSSLGACTGKAAYSPVTDADFTSLNTQLDGLDAKHLNDVLKASCEGSLAPARCIQFLQDAASHLHSGPTTLKGPTTTSTTSTTNADGTKSDTTTFKETQFQLGYNADGFTWRDDTTTTTTNPDGTKTVSHESTEDNSATPEQEKDDPLDREYAFEDKDFPEVTPFYEQKYKEGFKSVWEKNQASFDNSAFISFLKSFVPSFSGSCPAFGLSFNIATWANYGSMDFMSICYVLDFVKSILLVSSLFLCRALIFGG